MSPFQRKRILKSLPKTKRMPDSVKNKTNELLSFGGHLEVLRQMLFRVLTVIAILATVVFCFKDITWTVLLAPCECGFCTFAWIEQILHLMGWTDFHFEEYHVNLITTDLSSQFMMHITTSIYIGILLASPYILYELFRFITPALYENERRYSVLICVVVYILFILGVMMTYFVLFPISFRFLGTYNVAERVHSNITLDSYIETFTTLTLVMGIVFQLPVLAYILAKLRIITSSLLAHYRKHSFILIMTLAAIITPPDIMTLILVTIPLYLLFEISIRVIRYVES